MFKQLVALLEYLRLLEDINKIILGIILVGAIIMIFITYCFSNTFRIANNRQ